MVTIHREHGIRFVIYTMDHDPAHVHVCGDGEMKVSIRGADGLPQIVWSIGMKAPARRRAMDVVREHQAGFLARWHAIHGASE